MASGDGGQTCPRAISRWVLPTKWLFLFAIGLLRKYFGRLKRFLAFARGICALVAKNVNFWHIFGPHRNYGSRHAGTPYRRVAPRDLVSVPDDVHTRCRNHLHKTRCSWHRTAGPGVRNERVLGPLPVGLHMAFFDSKQRFELCSVVFFGFGSLLLLVGINCLLPKLRCSL